MERGEIERKIAQGLAYIEPKTGNPVEMKGETMIVLDFSNSCFNND